MNAARPARVLVVDDMPAIHADFRKILVPPGATALDDLEAELFGSAAPAPAEQFELDSAYQGREALDMVTAARDAGRPYAFAFVDMRMPPGWNGVETIEHLWEVDPALQVVICTAYSDQSWDDVTARMGGKDRVVVLRKPVDPGEVKELAGKLVGRQG
ncbi:MAG TPA: response regulator [Ramlibacter sp.]|nr:response regulator [Ramlibacter sp.]